MTPSKCPSKRDVIRFFEGRDRPAKRKKLLDHVLDCPRCLAVFEAAAEVRSRGRIILRDLEGLALESAESRAVLHQRAVEELRGLRRGRKGGPRRAVRWAAIPAAGAAAVLLIGLFLVPRLRTTAGGDVERNVTPVGLRLVSPRGGAERLPLTFRWSPAPEARDYRLEIYDRTLMPVFRSEPVGEGAFTLGLAQRPLLRVGETYFWKVAAVLKDQRTIESEFSKFTLQR